MQSFRIATDWDARTRPAIITNKIDWVVSKGQSAHPSTLRCLIVDNVNGPFPFLGASFSFFADGAVFAGQVTIGGVDVGSVLYYDEILKAGAELQASQFQTILTFAAGKASNLSINVNTDALAKPAIFDTLRLFFLPDKAGGVAISIAAIARNAI
ncbi:MULTISPECIES: hypothetical protein [unclassified Bradyrhizobium]|uniref:hypothetical protein n=1 Tax=unclassified Bradyrhizobium TaxID=2631580 RepID=UPI002915F2FE|nr:MULTISPECIES: hypothetical protein [unclassified Bradyrhizobium]